MFLPCRNVKCSVSGDTTHDVQSSKLKGFLFYIGVFSFILIFVSL